MRKFTASIIFVATLASPLSAAGWQDSGNVRPGAFVGARLRLSLGTHSPAKPEAALTIAPTRSNVSSDGRITTRIGDGMSLDFAGARPELKLGGIRVDEVLHLRQQGGTDAERKVGLSSGTWVGIGVAAVAIAAVVLVTQFTCVGKDRDYCGSQ
ncbi:MAG: hypothetical protein H0W65_08715 [Sphingomonas sp.]|uniref:hypothetical protein n=1 Tax=Sphingomonas sp. TaxID=28214 RepID=UPI001827C990|nr:hypothetical protein [Sphingomonas sp.]MBA3667789.1 hypothetical protein [Sphingomonas sp.]